MFVSKRFFEFVNMVKKLDDETISGLMNDCSNIVDRLLVTNERLIEENGRLREEIGALKNRKHEDDEQCEETE